MLEQSGLPQGSLTSLKRRTHVKSPLRSSKKLSMDSPYHDMANTKEAKLNVTLINDENEEFERQQRKMGYYFIKHCIFSISLYVRNPLS